MHPPPNLRRNNSLAREPSVTGLWLNCVLLLRVCVLIIYEKKITLMSALVVLSVIHIINVEIYIAADRYTNG